MQQKVKKSKKLVEQELKEREDVEKELNVVKAWIRDTKDTLLNSASEADMQLEEFQVQCCYKKIQYQIHIFCIYGSLVISVRTLMGVSFE